jgi:hypothetical protein
VGRSGAGWRGLGMSTGAVGRPDGGGLGGVLRDISGD